MENLSAGFISFSHFFYLTIGDLSVIIISIILWAWWWLSTDRLTLPDSSAIDAHYFESDIFRTNNRILLTNPLETFSFLRCILSEFDHEYFIQNLGLEAFLYIAFIRYLAKISAVLLFTDLCICIPYLYFFENPSKISWIQMQSQGNFNFRTTYSIMVAIIVLYSLYNFKKFIKARTRYSMMQDRRQMSLVMNWLKLRTLFIHMQSQDDWNTSPTKIKNYLQRFLNVQCEDRSIIYDIVLISSHGSMLRRQYDREYYKIIGALNAQDRPFLWQCLNINSAQTIKNEIQRLNEQILALQDKYSNRVIGAFIVVNTMSAVHHLSENFYLRSENKCCREGDIFDSEQNEKPSILISSSSHPGDIIWTNMNYYKSTVFRELLVNAVCIIILIFVSTPSTVLNLIKISPVFTTLSLILTNSLLTYFLSFMIQKQSNSRQSAKEIHQYTVLLVYLGINMILVSVARGIKNISDFLMERGGWHWIEIFQLVYRKVDGYFFCLLFINQTVISFIITLVKPSQLISNYGSPRLYIQTTSLHSSTMYGKNNNFQFGYSYALMVTLFIISIMYTASVPLLHLFSTIFYTTRLYLDSYTLLTFHKQETISMGKLTTKALLGSSIGVVVQLFLVANSLLIELQYINAIILYMVLMGALYVSFYLNKELVNAKDLMEDSGAEVIGLNSCHLQKWRELYSYPLKLD